LFEIFKKFSIKNEINIQALERERKNQDVECKKCKQRKQTYFKSIVPLINNNKTPSAPCLFVRSLQLRFLHENQN